VDGSTDLGVPCQILIAVFAKLTLYGFWRGEGLFAELLMWRHAGLRL
jgi:hypothetical protein